MAGWLAGKMVSGRIRMGGIGRERVGVDVERITIWE